MFVPVACSQCGKTFQVPEEGIGRPTVCPWCQAIVPARSANQPAPAAEPSPLLPAGPVAPAAAESQTAAPALISFRPQVAGASVSVPAPPLPRRWPWWLPLVSLTVLVLTAATTVLVLRYHTGWLADWEWRTVELPGGRCTVELPGPPAVDPDVGPDEQRYQAQGWYSGLRAWAGWRELGPPLSVYVGTTDAWRHLRPVFEAERDRLRERFGGETVRVLREATIRFEDPLTWELWLEYPGGKAALRAVVVSGDDDGTAPRVYFLGLVGPIDPAGPVARRFFESFRPAGS